MKSKDLATLWGRPDNSRLAPKQVSVRLPVHVLAKVRALEELFPTRTRTEIIGDLLSSALEEAVSGLPAYAGALEIHHPDDDRPLYKEAGPRAEFRQLANKHYREIETELGNAEPGKLYDTNYVMEKDE